LNKENVEEEAEGKVEEDISGWAWMDPSKKQQLANMESQMLDEYTQSIIKNGLRPMFEFNFFQVRALFTSSLMRRLINIIITHAD
jgi:hypothetical protein